MPLDYLRQISHEVFPLTISDPQEIDKLRVLAAAQMIEVDLPAVVSTGVAVVRKITGYGRAAISAPAPRIQGLTKM